MSWNSRQRPKIEEIDLTEPSPPPDSWQESPNQRSQRSDWRQQQQQPRQYGYSNQDERPQYGQYGYSNNQEQSPEYGYQGQPLNPQYGHPGDRQQYGHPNQPNARQPFNLENLSKEDIEILKRCNSQAFRERSLPLVALSSLGLFLAGRKGALRTTVWHYIGMGMVGFIAGKLSYRSRCEEMIISSGSKSSFANAVRRRRGIITEDSNNQDSISQLNNVPMESDWTTTNQEEMSYQENDNLPQQQRQKPRSYDDLRAQNRSSYKSA